MKAPARPSVPGFTVALDLDETVFPTAAACRAVPGGEAVQDSTWAGLLAACGEARRLDVLTRAVSYEHAISVGLFPGAATALRALALSHGVTWHLMTARPEGLAIEGLRLLRTHGIEPAGAAFGVSDKPALCDALRIRVLVDDDPQVLRAAHASGLSVVAPRRPHNRRVIDELGLPAASSWNLLHHIIARTVAEQLTRADQTASSDRAASSPGLLSTNRAGCRLEPRPRRGERSGAMGR